MSRQRKPNRPAGRVVRRENGLFVSQGKAMGRDPKKTERIPKWHRPKRVPERLEKVDPIDVTPDPKTGFVPKYLRDAVPDKQGRLRNPQDWRDEIGRPTRPPKP